MIQKQILTAESSLFFGILLPKISKILQLLQGLNLQLGVMPSVELKKTSAIFIGFKKCKAWQFCQSLVVRLSCAAYTVAQRFNGKDSDLDITQLRLQKVISRIFLLFSCLRYDQQVISPKQN